ncbi:glycosyltransferase family 4 protein [Hoeflea sp. WL0058]|uniref:Glycosyltransferase family 4 protein n=1 Tax=Flavimaribacter sediminis TaxID=2865987 RepID=A0AAE3CZY9_9HYPH|nr:glycosyltransferase family 4 protein [Flavimaribacter sediminis]
MLAPPDESIANLQDAGCSFVPLEMDVKGLNPIEDLKLVRAFRRHFLELRPDAVLSYTIKNNIFGALAARLAKVPFIPNVTGLGTAFLSGGMLQTVAELLYRSSYRNLPVVFFQNDDDRDLFLKRRLVRPGQTQLLPGSGIDLLRYAAAPLPAENQPPIFLMISRLLRDKGVYEYVEAAQRVKQRFPTVQFQILGAIGADNRTAIDATEVDAWKNEGLIEHLGTTDDVRPHIANAHCVVLPSYREGAPRTLIEGAAMARPLIATDVPGCRSIVDPDESGYLCEVRSGSSLAEACFRFLDLSYAEKMAMGTAGRRKMERQFDERIIIDSYFAALGKVVTGNPEIFATAPQKSVC